MDFSKISLLTGLTERIRFLSARSSVIAQNIANANTPGYKAKELEAPDFQKMIAPSSATLKVTHPRHQQNNSIANGPYKQTRSNEGVATLTDNQVSVETETMKLSQARMEYGLASTVYRKSLDMIRLAARSDR